MSYGGFCPKNVDKCPCLTGIVNKINEWDIQRLNDIRRAVEDIHLGSGSERIDSPGHYSNT